MTSPSSAEPADATGQRPGADVRLRVTAGGEPSPQELAAIVTAVLVTQPRPVAPTPATPPPRWRFSGRWWSKPIPLRRARPH